MVVGHEDADDLFRLSHICLRNFDGQLGQVNLVSENLDVLTT